MCNLIISIVSVNGLAPAGSEATAGTVMPLSGYCISHWGRDKMAAIFQTTFSNAFSWLKMFEFQLRFHWILFPGVQLTIFQHWLRSWLGTSQATSHYLNQWWFVYWRIYASLGLNELNMGLAFDGLKTVRLAATNVCNDSLAVKLKISLSLFDSWIKNIAYLML